MRIFLILLLASLAGCADEARRAREADEQREIAVAELTARGTAQSLAAASLLGDYKHARLSQALIDRSVAIAPDQPALAYVQWRECATAGTCAEEKEIRARLQAVAPDNGLVWLPELSAAWERADGSAVTRAVAKIGASGHISIYWNSLTVMLVDAFGEKSPSTGRPVFARSPADRMVYAFGILAAVSIPPSQAMASARRRQLDYVMVASSRVRVLHLDGDSARRLEAMRESNHELDVSRAMLAFLHEPLEPPANWKDPYARGE